MKRMEENTGVTKIQPQGAVYVYAAITPELLQVSPVGQIPLPELDGTPVMEPRAIARVLATRNSDVQLALVPDYASDPKAFALLEQALSVETMKLEPNAVPLCRTCSYWKLLSPLLPAFSVGNLTVD
ncbi:hypothetical protein K432DRAFT_425430 [Lepidopterella palustris CBS 459.81]|uniref:Uncharacterized protein n=1 Tax=Lepidopterella palustris CBS 459.81 TaxID=1314670 RepID=A0A8E2EBQ1_9PEZI|nr:hypothetical protein K432DRAFT_425430 [Lepidopterella palustris CBS 459.81]